MSEVKIITENVFDIVASTVRKAGKAVRPTFGPASNKVLIDKQLYRMVVDDGVQVMRDLEYSDPAENAVLKVIKETSIKTNDRVGDGTTGAMIMLEEIISGVADLSRREGHKIERELKVGAKEAVEQIRAMAKKVVTKEDLLKVAMVSYDNPDVAEIIADTWHKVGPDGSVTIEGSPTTETYSELAEGVMLKQGFISPFMVTNPQRMEAIVEQPFVLVTDYRLTNSDDVLPILNEMAKAGKNKLVIICEHVEDAALATLVINHPNVMNPHTKAPGVVQSVAINAPKNDDMAVALADIAMMVGARFFSQKKGDRLQTATLSDLGRADRFISKRDSSVIVRPKGDRKVIKKAIEDLKLAIENTKDAKSKEVLKWRLGLFTNQVAVIKVGADTDNEQKAKRYKVEDSVNAVRAAYKGGVVAGGGIALAAPQTSSQLLNRALKRPHRQLLENMGLEPRFSLAKGDALNVVTGEEGPWMKVGVLDPADVLVAAIESAVSIASVLITMSAIIVEVPPDPKRE